MVMDEADGHDDHHGDGHDRLSLMSCVRDRYRMGGSGHARR